MIIQLHDARQEKPYPLLEPTLVSLGSDQVLLVELQGSLVTEGDTSGERVGTLAIDSKTNKPTLKIGNHLLEGTIQSLPKPYAVIARSTDPPSKITRLDDVSAKSESAQDEEMLVDGDANNLHAQSELEPEPSRPDVSYDIITIVKKKIVFAKRPVPIVPSNLKSG